MKIIGTLLFSLIALRPGFSTDPEIVQLIEKAVAASQISPFSLDITIGIGHPAQPGTVAMIMAGNLTFQDARHLRMDLDIALNMFGRKMESTVMVMADGKDYWLQESKPGEPMPQVIRADVSVMEEMKQTLDPKAFKPEFFLDALKLLNLQMGSEVDGLVTLTGQTNQAFIAFLQKDNPSLGQVPTDTRIEATLHRDNVFPVGMKVLGETGPFLTVGIDNMRRPTAAEVKQKLQYTPPKGVPVMDAKDLLHRQ